MASSSRDVPARSYADDEDDFNPRFAQMRLDNNVHYPISPVHTGQFYQPYFGEAEYMHHQRARTSPMAPPIYEYAYGGPAVSPPWTRQGSFAEYPTTPPTTWMPQPSYAFQPESVPVQAFRNRQNRTSWNGPSKEEVERRPYHPQAPAKRSDWVMWVGNVPPNTSHEELWRYFNTNVPAPDWKGPSSIFLISRSSCAFVNLSSQEDLDRAVVYYNGKPLRSWDARCPRMVCRIRRKDDDLKSGVGGQRGTGMHKGWVKAQEQAQGQGQEQERPNLEIEPISPAVFEHPPDGEGRRRESVVVGNNSSNSFASTNSSFLIRHFPRRFFILKSATTAELEEAAETSIWRTQKHNESILDQAFRTATEVILIFGANKTGEFFGYAKMVEPIDKDKAARRAALAENLGKGLAGGGATGVEAAAAASAADAPLGGLAQAQRSAPVLTRSPPQERARAGTEPTKRPKMVEGESFVQTDSPNQMTPADEAPPMLRSMSDQKEDSFSSEQSIVSAPAAFPDGGADSSDSGLSGEVQARLGSADVQARLGSSARPQELGLDGVLRKDTVLSAVERVQAGLVSRGKEMVEALEGGDGMGLPFRIEWLRVGSLPFSHTRNLRNPWNNDREVKISRDGTEVEPGIGDQLIQEWDKATGPQRVARPPPVPLAPHYPLSS